MEANDRQEGGDHYKRLDYETWDFIPDLNIPFHPACAIKYVSRWRRKNGVEDLKKAVHYIEKARERDSYMTFWNVSEQVRYMSQFNTQDRLVIDMVIHGHYDAACGELERMIDGVDLAT